MTVSAALTGYVNRASDLAYVLARRAAAIVTSRSATSEASSTRTASAIRVGPRLVSLLVDITSARLIAVEQARDANAIFASQPTLGPSRRVARRKVRSKRRVVATEYARATCRSAESSIRLLRSRVDVRQHEVVLGSAPRPSNASAHTSSPSIPARPLLRRTPLQDRGPCRRPRRGRAAPASQVPERRGVRLGPLQRWRAGARLRAVGRCNGEPPGGRGVPSFLHRGDRMP